MSDKGTNISKESLVDIGWQQMSQILDVELPQEKKRRKFLWWWFSGLGVAAIALSFLWASGGFVEPELATPIQSESPVVKRENKTTVPVVAPKKEMTPPVRKQSLDVKKESKQTKTPPIAASKRLAPSIQGIDPIEQLEVNVSKKPLTTVETNTSIEKNINAEKAATSLAETGVYTITVDYLPELPFTELDVPSMKESLKTLKIKKRRKNLAYLSLDVIGVGNSLSWTGGNLEAGLIFNAHEKMNLSVGLGVGLNTIALKSVTPGIIRQYSDEEISADPGEVFDASINPIFTYPSSEQYNNEALNVSKTDLSQGFYSKQAYIYLPIRLGYRLSPRFFLQTGVQLSYLHKVGNFTYDGVYSVLDELNRKNADSFPTTQGQSPAEYSLIASLSNDWADNRTISYNSSVVSPVSIHSWLLDVNFRIGYQINRNWSTTLQFSKAITPVSSSHKLIKRQNNLTIGLGLRRTF